MTDGNGNVIGADDDLRRRVCFGNVARVFGPDPTGTFVQADCDEDGKPDGWIKVQDLSPHFGVRPAWVNNRARRINLTRRDTFCEPRP